MGVENKKGRWKIIEMIFVILVLLLYIQFKSFISSKKMMIMSGGGDNNEHNCSFKLDQFDTTFNDRRNTRQKRVLQGYQNH